MSLTRKYGRFIEMHASYLEDRKDVKEWISKHHRHQLVHNLSSSKINDGVHSVASKKKFYCNVEMHSPGGVVL